MNVDDIIKSAKGPKEKMAEQVDLEANIQAHVPEDKRDMCIKNLEFLLQMEYLRGQRDALIESIEKQKSKAAQEQST